MAANHFKVGLISFILGVGLASFIIIDLRWLFILAGVGIVLLIPKKSKGAGLAIIFLLLGMGRYQAVKTPDLNKYFEQEISFTGIVDQEPDERINQQRLTIRTEEFNTHFLVTTYLYPAYAYGDELKINGKLQEPKVINDFDYKGYLERYDIYGILYQPKLEKIGEYQTFKKILFSFKQKMSEKLKKHLTEPACSLMQGILLAQGGLLSEEVKSSFSQTGISHIVAISGQNITIISGLLLNFLLGLGLNRKQSFYAAILILLIYLVILGSPASALRATVMGLLVMWAMYLGRLNTAFNAILLSACLMLLINPKLFWYDVGFQLSFAAVAGIIYIKPIFDKLTEPIPDRFNIKENLTMTLAAQATTFSLMAYHFKQLSLIAPLANILIVPLLPLVMILGMAGIFLAFLISPLSQLVFYILSLIISYIVKTTDLLSQLPYAYLPISHFSPYYIVISFFLIFFIILLVRKKKYV